MTVSMTAPEFRRIDIPFAPLRDGAAIPETISPLLGAETGEAVVVLDAAANHQVPELLHADTPEACCLWQGQAEAEMADAAPWIAPLRADGAILRNLLSEGTAPWQWWGNWPGVILHARRGIDPLRRHLRRLNRITDRTKDQTPRSYFLRWWEPSTAAAFWASHTQRPDHVAWRFGEDVAAVYWPTPNGLAGIAMERPLPHGPPPDDTIDAYRPLFRAVRWDSFVARVVQALAQAGAPYDRVPRDVVGDMCDAARRAGYRSEDAIWDVVRATIQFDAKGHDLQQEAALAWAGAKPPDTRVAARRLLAHATAIPDKKGKG